MPEFDETVDGGADFSSEGVRSGDGVHTNEIPNASAEPGSIEALEGHRVLGDFVPRAGDRVLLNGQLAELEVYDPAGNIFTANIQVGRSINRLTDHITTNRFESLEAASVGHDGLDAALSETNTIASARQETLDEGLSRTLASQGNQFTSLEQQRLLSQQPHAGDPLEVALAKRNGEAVETPSDSVSVDPNAPAEATDNASVDQSQAE